MLYEVITLELSVPEDRADVELAVISLAQARDALDHLLDEGVRDFIDDVYALGSAADVAAVQEGSHDGAARVITSYSIHYTKLYD